MIAAHPGEIVLYCLFLIVLAIATGLISCFAICITCCIAALPYLGTVILLPVFILLRSFSLVFLRQFGPDYDVWSPSCLPNSYRSCQVRTDGIGAEPSTRATVVVNRVKSQGKDRIQKSKNESTN